MTRDELLELLRHADAGRRNVHVQSAIQATRHSDIAASVVLHNLILNLATANERLTQEKIAGYARTTPVISVISSCPSCGYDMHDAVMDRLKMAAVKVG